MDAVRLLQQRENDNGRERTHNGNKRVQASTASINEVTVRDWPWAVLRHVKNRQVLVEHPRPTVDGGKE